MVCISVEFSSVSVWQLRFVGLGLCVCVALDFGDLVSLFGFADLAVDLVLGLDCLLCFVALRLVLGFRVLGFRIFWVSGFLGFGLL